MLFGIARDCGHEHLVKDLEFRCREFEELELDDALRKKFKWYYITFSKCWRNDEYDVSCAFKCYSEVLKSITIESFIEPFTRFSEVIAVVLVPLTLPWFSRYNLALPHAVWYRKPVDPFVATSSIFVKLIRWLLRGYALLLDDTAFLALPRDSSVLERELKLLDVSFLEVTEIFNGILIKNRDVNEYLSQLSKLLKLKE